MPVLHGDSLDPQQTGKANANQNSFTFRKGNWEITPLERVF